MRFLYLLFFLPLATLGAQDTYVVSLKPGVSSGADTWVYNRNDRRDDNYDHHPTLLLGGWTGGGIPFTVHAYLRFDLTALPPGAAIEAATLDLYHDPESTSGYGTGHHGDRTDFYVQRVTSAYESTAVTWNDRPEVTTDNQVLVTGPTEPRQDMLDIDVTDLVQDQLTYGNEGFQLRLADESPYTVVIAASANHPDGTLHPRLTITYSSADCGTFTLSDKFGQDANTWSGNPTNEYGLGQQLTVYNWTNQGAPAFKRAFLEFDLSAVPDDAELTAAELSLFFTPNNPDMYGSHHNSNALAAFPIVEPWNETSLTWNNQPAVDTDVSWIIPATENEQADIRNIDVLEMMTYLRATPGTHGFGLRIDQPGYYRGVMIASGQHSEPAYRPRLKVCWNRTTSTTADADGRAPLLSVFPNPTTGRLTVDLSPVPAGQLTYDVIDLRGRSVVAPQTVTGRARTDVYLGGAPAGVYVLRCRLDGRPYAVRRVVVGKRLVRP